MNEKKNDALPQAGTSASPINSTNGSIPQNSASVAANTAIVKPPTHKDGGKGVKTWDLSKCHPLHLESKVRSCAIKIYDEQMPHGWDYVQDAIHATNKKDFHVIAICHYRDTYADEGHFWKIATEKRHFHIIVRCTNNRTIRVKNILDGLGIVFRKGLDDELWAKHGCETVGDFAAYATYLTHDTEKAKKEAKEHYDIKELVSNLSIEEINQVRDGYMRLAAEPKRLSLDEYIKYDKESFQLGYEMKSFADWYNALPFVARNSARMKTIRESYDRGIDKRLEEKQEVVRLCVFIQGEHNTGKTYAASHALADKKRLVIDGGGTGKFDKLRPDHDAIIFDDETCPNVLNMSDNKMCRAYRRKENNPVWAGHYLIVTYNNDFEQWLNDSGFTTRDKETGKENEHFRAMKSRFYICELRQRPIDSEGNTVNYLALKHPSDRGTPEEQYQRLEMFYDFKEKFDEIIASYHPGDKENVPDYGDAIDSDWRFRQMYPAIVEASEKMRKMQLEKEAAEKAKELSEKWDSYCKQYKKETLQLIYKRLSGFDIPEDRSDDIEFMEACIRSVVDMRFPEMKTTQYR